MRAPRRLEPVVDLPDGRIDVLARSPLLHVDSEIASWGDVAQEFERRTHGECAPAHGKRALDRPRHVADIGELGCEAGACSGGSTADAILELTNSVALLLRGLRTVEHLG